MGDEERSVGAVLLTIICPTLIPGVNNTRSVGVSAIIRAFPNSRAVDSHKAALAIPRVCVHVSEGHVDACVRHTLQVIDLLEPFTGA